MHAATVCAWQATNPGGDEGGAAFQEVAACIHANAHITIASTVTNGHTGCHDVRPSSCVSVYVLQGRHASLPGTG